MKINPTLLKITRCPSCKHFPLDFSENTILCPACLSRYQIIDDNEHKTLFCANTRTLSGKVGDKKDAAKQIGIDLVNRGSRGV